MNGYSTAILSSYTEIRQLRDAARRLTQQDDTVLDPEFFLASFSKGWAPRVVTVRRGGATVGMVYAKERVISGLIPTGIVYADGSLGDILLAHPSHQLNAFRSGMEALLASPGIHGLRLRLLRNSIELAAIRQLIASRAIDVHCSRIKPRDAGIWKNHAHVRLPDSYEQLLAALGSTTRHNFRYYRRRFESSGHRLIESLTLDELRSAALALAPKSKFTDRLTRIEIEQRLGVVAAARRPLAIALKHKNGDWLSAIGGWYGSGGAVLLFQFNNEREFYQDSIALVLRVYLIETLIRQGLKKLVIWAGTGPPLSRYASFRPSIAVHVDLPTFTWRAARFVISRVGPWLPTPFADMARWIVAQ